MVFTPTTKTQLKNAVYRWTTGEREGLGTISEWDTSQITDMSGLFMDNSYFNHDISRWDVSNVTNMARMFYRARTFNQPIGDWIVSNVTNMGQMFYFAEAFNQPIGDWIVSKVSTMQGMFENAKTFNQPIGNWDVSKVTDMRYMFENSGYTHPKPGEAPPKPPPCMSQTEYEKCKVPEDENDPENKNKIVKCPLTLEELDIKDAVKLPNQPNTCYDRKRLKHQFTIKKINPVTNEELEDEDWFKDWNNENMGDEDCEPQTEGGKGKGKRKTKKRKTKKSTKKTKKQTKKKTPKRKKRT